MFSVELICFGNELLIGKTVNTNANWLGKQIISFGGQISRITTVGDTLDEMVAILKEVIDRSPDVVITTGGMGTTFDDLSLAAVAKAIEKKMVHNEVALESIKNRIKIIKKKRNVELELTEERKQMALLPEGAIALPNTAGTAPGVFVEYKGVKIFSVPGVPREMKDIFDNEIIKHLPKDPNKMFFEHSIVVNHIPESELAKSISNIREEYPDVYFKTHPSSSTTSKKRIIEVEIHLTAMLSKDKGLILDEIVDKLINHIKTLTGVQNNKPVITLKENNETE